MFLREITLNFIVIGQRHCGRVTVIPSRGKKVPDGVDMLAFYNIHNILQYRHECFTECFTSVLLENIPLVKLIKTTSGTQVVYFP